MVNEIIEAVALALDTEFGDGYPVYRQDVEQGAETPCFLVLLMSTQSLSQVGERVRQMNNFVVQYFPVDGGDNAEMHRVGEALLWTLSWITLLNGSKLRGVDRRFEIVNDVLHCFVSYNAFLQVLPDTDPMEILRIQAGVMEEGPYGEN